MAQIAPPIPPPIPPNVTTENERVMACGVNIASIPFPYLGPIVGFFVSNGSKYVQYNAVRSIIEQVVIGGVCMLVFVMSCACTGASVLGSMEMAKRSQERFGNPSSFPVPPSFSDPPLPVSPPEFDSKSTLLAALFGNVAIAGGFLALSVVMFVRALILAYQAYHGEPIRPRYFTERMAARFVGLP